MGEVIVRVITVAFLLLLQAMALSFAFFLTAFWSRSESVEIVVLILLGATATIFGLIGDYMIIRGVSQADETGKRRKYILWALMPIFFFLFALLLFFIFY